MPVPYIAQTDNTSVAPIKVMPVFDPKYKTTFAFTDQYGKRMFVTPSKAKNATVKEDKRSKHEKEISKRNSASFERNDVGAVCSSGSYAGGEESGSEVEQHKRFPERGEDKNHQDYQCKKNQD